MFAANTYLIRPATDDDASLSRLAEFGSNEPLPGRVLIGQIDGVPAAAISLADGRIIADPGRSTAHLLACLRVRAGAIRAYDTTPSLQMRMLAGLRTTKHSGSAADPEGESGRDRAARPAPSRRTRQPHVRSRVVTVSD